MKLYQGARRLPSAHVSIRVPWHDTAWDGRVCKKPTDNISCLILKNVREKKDDKSEEEIAGKSWEELENNQIPFPPCLAERVGFLRPTPLDRKIKHPYRDSSVLHGHFKETNFRTPQYSADCIPFGWMLRDFAEEKAEKFDISFSLDEEKEATDKMGFGHTWLQARSNQLSILDTFFSAIVPNESLCFFYAKRTPLSDDPRRTIIGVGKVTSVGEPKEYEYSEKGKHRAMIWERTVQHSIRANKFEGFLFPYHQLLEKRNKEKEFLLNEYVAYAPDTAFSQFSYVTEHVSHDNAVASLLVCSRILKNLEGVIEGDWQKHLNWVDTQLNRLWKLRGAYPGLGSALKAFGVSKGALLAYQLSLELNKDNNSKIPDPWKYLDSLMKDNSVDSDCHQYIDSDIKKTWNKLSKERKLFLELLARIALTEEQAIRFYIASERKEYGYQASDKDILTNPYLLYELDRHRFDNVSLDVIDRGIYPDKTVAERFPLAKEYSPTGPFDSRRVRSLIIDTLEIAANDGDTLLPKSDVIQKIREKPIEPSCDLGEDTIVITEEYFDNEIIKKKLKLGDDAYQLQRLSNMGAIIKRTVTKKIKGKRHEGDHDWRTMIDNAIPGNVEDELEKRARQEKIEALKEIYGSRFSVLIGPAGTGKTLLLKVLSSLPEVKNDGILMLAPTGKARVRMEQQTGISGASTVAQFLLGLDRYNPETQRSLISENAPRSDTAKTVIIDEASMLTEEDLAAVLDAVKLPHRIILVGDPQQLPPIGAGRPFVDIVRFLRPDNIDAAFPKVGSGYAELTVIMRQKETEQRDDLDFAQWFSGKHLHAGMDEIWQKLNQGNTSKHIRSVEWNTPDELEKTIFDILVEEIPEINDKEDQAGFEESLGGVQFGDYIYFNNKYNDRKGSAESAENWQLLSPVNGEYCGIVAINRLIQNTFRIKTKQLSRERYRKTPKPMGNEGIVYGDKVINVRNHRHYSVFPKEDALNYVANGEIGTVVGQFKGRKSKLKKLPWQLEVEFSSQLGFKYNYSNKYFSEEGDEILSLAYALTVHKVQGSEFGLSILILPNPCLILSRELLYTALTRHRDKVVILHQGPLTDLRDYSFDYHSVTARRLTNLFEEPDRVLVHDRYFEEGLIHRTDRGEMVRSKSEVIIANLLNSKGLEYAYESPLLIDGVQKLPDFTIEDPDSGEIVYWEHLGMLSVPQYKSRWEKKRDWYLSVGIIPFEEGGGKKGILVTTEDDEHGGIDSKKISEFIDRVFDI